MLVARVCVATDTVVIGALWTRQHIKFARDDSSSLGRQQNAVPKAAPAKSPP